MLKEEIQNTNITSDDANVVTKTETPKEVDKQVSDEVVQDYVYTDLGIVIKATSKEEADKKLQEIINNKQNNDSN